MPKRQLMLNIDDGLLQKAESIAEQQGRSLKDLLVEYLHQMVKADKRRRLRREFLRPLVDVPTQSLRECQGPGPGAPEENPGEQFGEKPQQKPPE